LTKKAYFSHGKLLLSGEFLVLEGATALAVPLKTGQHLNVFEGNDPALLKWVSKHKKHQWFECTYHLRELEIIDSTDKARAEFIRKILISGIKNNHLFSNELEGKSVEAVLDFNPSWGWGSSSTLISNIAFWSGTNPFDLFFDTQEGSGYDIACARASSPILYTMNGNSPSITEVKLKKAVTPYIYFVYLGHKQSTADGIRLYRQSRVFDKMDIQSISEISLEMVKATNLEDFNALIKEHERIIGKVIQKRSVKQELFADFPGEVKSLGTWGGDFVMMTFEGDEQELKAYLKPKKLDKLFSYREIAI
jgi:mevalonate kinase